MVQVWSSDNNVHGNAIANVETPTEEAGEWNQATQERLEYFEYKRVEDRESRINKIKFENVNENGYAT